MFITTILFSVLTRLKVFSSFRISSPFSWTRLKIFSSFVILFRLGGQDWKYVHHFKILFLFTGQHSRLNISSSFQISSPFIGTRLTYWYDLDMCSTWYDWYKQYATYYTWHTQTLVTLIKSRVRLPKAVANRHPPREHCINITRPNI